MHINQILPSELCHRGITVVPQIKARPGKCSRSGLGMVKTLAVFYFTSTFVAEPFTVTMYAPGAA